MLDLAQQQAFNADDSLLEPVRAEYHFSTSSFAAPALEHQFPYSNQVLPMRGGSEFLHLGKPLVLCVKANGSEISVVDWNVRIVPSQVAASGGYIAHLEREVVRRFDLLATKAAAQMLSESEMLEWQKMSDYVDFGRYSETSSLPTYMEGLILRKPSRHLRLVLDDGRKLSVPASLATEFEEFNDGERVGAYLKFDREDSVTHVHGVKFALGPSVKELEEFERWLSEKKL